MRFIKRTITLDRAEESWARQKIVGEPEQDAGERIGDGEIDEENVVDGRVMASDTEPTDDADDKDIQGHPSPFLVSIVWNTGRLSVCLSHRSTAVTALSGFAAERPAMDFASFQSGTQSMEPERHSRSRNLESVAFRLLYNYNGSRTPRLCLGRSSSDPSWGSYDSDARWLSDSSTVLLFVLFVRALSNHFVVVS